MIFIALKDKARIEIQPFFSPCLDINTYIRKFSEKFDKPGHPYRHDPIKLVDRFSKIGICMNCETREKEWHLRGFFKDTGTLSKFEQGNVINAHIRAKFEPLTFKRQKLRREGVK